PRSWRTEPGAGGGAAARCSRRAPGSSRRRPRASNYQERIVETATAFASELDGVWQLLPNRDLAFIKTSNTANGRVEVHIASRASNYQAWMLEVATMFSEESDGV